MDATTYAHEFDQTASARTETIPGPERGGILRRRPNPRRQLPRKRNTGFAPTPAETTGKGIRPALDVVLTAAAG